jgi:N-acetylglucosamine malate deacetylase 2
VEMGTKDAPRSEMASLARSVTGTGDALPGVRRLLVVIAHPDDESFGLGSLLSAFVAEGTSVSVLCFTQGEHSTLGAECTDLASVRCRELSAAARVLGIAHTTLLSYPDGRLTDAPLDELIHHVLQHATDTDALVVFDEGGVTGHPDHCHATAAAIAAADVLDLPVLSWAIPHTVAEQLNAEFRTSFVGRDEAELDLTVEVDRTRQLKAIACHRSQTVDNPVLWRRLRLLGDREWLRYLRPMAGRPVQRLLLLGSVDPTSPGHPREAESETAYTVRQARKDHGLANRNQTDPADPAQ